MRDLPALWGQPIWLEILPELSVVRRKLLSKGGRGVEVYAGSFIRERRIVLESSLLLQPDLLRAILVHELFHFAWARLGNGWRCSFASLLQSEGRRRARGELGESSGVAKATGLSASSRWKNYVCESFCDTAAYLFTGSTAGACRRLGKGFVAARREWFVTAGASGWKL